MHADSILIYTPGTYIETVVRDTGSGISPEDLPRIFEPFFTTKEIGKGTGLGLPSVYGMVIQNKGYIEVDSSIGVGSAFRIGFPLHVSEPRSKDSDDMMVHGKGCILLVEDEKILCRATKVSLELIGYTVTATGDPLEAAQLVEDGHQFDLLLSDIVMPVMSGIILRETIMPFLPNIRTIFMSGYHGENAVAPDTNDGLRYGSGNRSPCLIFPGRCVNCSTGNLKRRDGTPCLG